MNVKLLAHIPFSSPWIFRHLLGNAKTVLDVGCGDGSLMLKVNYDKKFTVTGVDLYKPYLEKANSTGVYKEIISSDIRKIKFKDQSFDIVIASQVIEHLNKNDAFGLIKKIEKIAKKRVIIATPNGFVKYDPFEGRDGNILQEHKSGWKIQEMKRRGYKIFGQGIGFIYSPSGLLYRYRGLKNILTIAALLLSPLAYFSPEASACIIAVKTKSNA